MSDSDRVSLSASIGGILLGLFGTEAVALVAGFAVFTTESNAHTTAQFVLMVIEFAIGMIAAITLLSSIFTDRPSRGPFLIGFLIGLSVISLTNGVCWYSNR